MKRSPDESKRYSSAKRNTGCHYIYEKSAGRCHVTFFANRIGSPVVVDKNDKILGIVAPNDVLKAVHSNTESVAAMTVGEVMTEDVIVGMPEDDVDQMMAIMTRNRIRHIPIIDNGRLGTGIDR